MSLLEQVKLLHDAGLHSNVKMVANLVLSASEHSPDVLTMAQKYQIQVWYGDALYEGEEYRKAESVYKRALQMKKVLNKSRARGGQSTVTSEQDLPQEVDVKYRIHECHCHLKQLKEAVGVLESIPGKQKTPKVNMALAKLYQKAGLERSSITYFREVLKECPMALEAVLCLLSLGVKGAEVASLTMNNLPTLSNVESWLTSLVKGHAHAALKDYSKAITIFKTLESKSILRDSTELLHSLAEAYFMSGDLRNALQVFVRLHSLDADWMRGMDIYAYLLSEEKEVKELESLASLLMAISESKPEPWVAMGYYCAVTKKPTRAIYFAQKAFTIDSRNAQSVILKGSVLKECNKTSEAILHFREAIRIAPHRFEAHKGLVECLVAAHRLKEAATNATNACRTLGNTPRSLTLLSSVLAKESQVVDKAKCMLEKALSMDPSHLDAVYVMAEILGKEQKYDKAIELLRNQLRLQSTCRLHQMLGDYLAATNDHQEALDQYSIALSMDPTNRKAMEGLQKVEQATDGIEGSADDDLDGMEESAEEAEMEPSDTDVEWPDQEWFN
ncbi:anaphase-promoting complex subunit 7-like [Ptychodera flava]|uniref:anaphase-promoting complex subunit 7-like n=1 Tax=Ptychodera flava TaxID=63121 RepID=UPI003969C53A